MQVELSRNSFNYVVCFFFSPLPEIADDFLAPIVAVFFLGWAADWAWIERSELLRIKCSLRLWWVDELWSILYAFRIPWVFSAADKLEEKLARFINPFFSFVPLFFAVICLSVKKPVRLLIWVILLFWLCYFLPPGLLYVFVDTPLTVVIYPNLLVCFYDL